MSDAYYHYRRDNDSSSVANEGKVFCVNEEYKEMDRFLSELPETEMIVRKTYARMRYQTYRWNYNRIDWLYKYAFVKRAAEEFSVLSKNNSFDQSLFTEEEWRNLQKVMMDPDGYFKESLNHCSYTMVINKQAEQIEQLEQRIISLKQSNSYRAGRTITAVPRMIKRKRKD